MTNKEAIRILGLECDEWDVSHCTASERREAFEMAITALENNSNEQLNNSNITQFNGIENKVKGLTACRVPGDDTISRREAIDALYKMLHDCFWADDEELDAVITTLNDLPSVQPERTCVNCGRTVNNGGWYADGGTRCPIEEHYALPKDGYCHLWEKRNVTDDDYPERRTDER